MPDDSYFTVQGNDGIRYGWFENASCIVVGDGDQTVADDLMDPDVTDGMIDPDVTGGTDDPLVSDGGCKSNRVNTHEWLQVSSNTLTKFDGKSIQC